MNADSPFRRSMNTVTDTLVVGLLITVASLPLVSAFAAIRAGVVVLVDQDAGGNLMGRFVFAFRQGLRKNLLLGTMIVAAAVIGSADLVMGMTGQMGLATVPVEAAGMLLLLAVLVLPFWAAAMTRATPATSLGTLFRGAALVAAARPAHSAVVFTAALAAAAATGALPILAPVAVGVLARISGRLPFYGLKPETLAQT